MRKILTAAAISAALQGGTVATGAPVYTVGPDSLFYSGAAWYPAG